MTATGPDDPMERIRAVFEQPYPSLPVPPGTWERIETEARRRRRTHRLRLVGSVAASLLVVGAAAGLLWPRNPAPVGPGTGSGTVGSTSTDPTQLPSTSPSTGAPVPSSPTSTGSGVLDGLPKGGTVPKGFWPVSLSGTAEGLLYVMGDAPDCGNPVCTSMVRSTDGGKTWVGIHAPEAEVGGDTPDAVREIRFASARDGYAYGPTLFETHDGGDHWTRRPMADEQVLDLAVDGDRIWAVLATCDGNGCASPRLVSAPASGGAFTEETGVRIPGPVTTARLTDGGGMLALRADSQEGTGQWVRQRGSGWRSVTAPCAVVTDFALNLIGLVPAADGSGDLVALCVGADPKGQQVAVVTISQDGGRSWAAGGLQPVPNGEILLAAADRDRFVLAFQPPGTDPALLVSRDAGQTWEPATGDVPTAFGFRWVGAGGGGSVYALVGPDGLLYRSTKGTRVTSSPIQ